MMIRAPDEHPGDAWRLLDPFSGAGTTALVADRLQRHGIGIELNSTYGALARNRIVDDAPLFAAVVVMSLGDPP
jgi:hypothetical protein